MEIAMTALATERVIVEIVVRASPKTLKDGAATQNVEIVTGQMPLTAQDVLHQVY
jgi:hypothetical protein